MLYISKKLQTHQVLDPGNNIIYRSYLQICYRNATIQHLLEQSCHVKTCYSWAKPLSAYPAAVATTHTDALTGFALDDAGGGDGSAEEMQRSSKDKCLKINLWFQLGIAAPCTQCYCSCTNISSRGKQFNTGTATDTQKQQLCKEVIWIPTPSSSS